MFGATAHGEKGKPGGSNVRGRGWETLWQRSTAREGQNLSDGTWREAGGGRRKTAWAEVAHVMLTEQGLGSRIAERREERRTGN
jgi:hypothetical protein